MGRQRRGQTLSLLQVATTHSTKTQEVLADKGRGFALRKSRRRRGEQAWRQMLTTYTPEPWFVALAREPVRPGHRPAANR